MSAREGSGTSTFPQGEALAQWRERVSGHRPILTRDPARYPQAGVLVPLLPSAEVLFTLRAQTLSTHRGEVSFPGGRLDRADADLCVTALREAHEELSLPASAVEVLGPLSVVRSRLGVQVSPWVGVVHELSALRANPQEVAEVFCVPLEVFAEDRRALSHRIHVRGEDWYVPGYQYAGYTIWGLTAIILVELVNVLYKRDLDLRRPPAGGQIVDLDSVQRGRTE